MTFPPKFLLNETKVVVPLKVSSDICRDPKDLKVLGTAWAEKADIIVTGDKHLQDIMPSIMAKPPFLSTYQP